MCYSTPKAELTNSTPDGTTEAGGSGKKPSQMETLFLLNQGQIFSGYVAHCQPLLSAAALHRNPRPSTGVNSTPEPFPHPHVTPVTQVRAPEDTELTGASLCCSGQCQGRKSSESRTCQMFAGSLSPFTLTHSNSLGSRGCWLREN